MSASILLGPPGVASGHALARSAELADTPAGGRPGPRARRVRSSGGPLRGARRRVARR